MATPSLERAKQLLEAAQPIVSNMARARLSGASFNLFRVLRMEEDEVRLHSRFIAELLDPRGSHGQGSAFLEMFLRQVACSLPGDFKVDADEARVEAPHYIGPTLWKDEDSTGGSIDIFVTDDARHISIENKIHHGEGDHQVDRYCNYRPESNFVLFLTLDGRDAHTAKKNKSYYAPISYGAHIVPWLERCHKHCTDLPVLRESIKQYLVVVRELSGGDPLMNQVDEDVKRLLRKNMEAARLIYLHFEPTLHEAVREFAKSMEREMKPQLEPAWKFQDTIEDEDDPNDKGVEIWSEAWPHRGNRWWVKWQYRKGHFEYGLLNPDRKGRDKIKDLGLDESVVGLKFYERDPWWAFWKRMDTVPNLEDDMTALERLLDEHERSRLAKEVADELLEFVHACDGAFKATG